MRSLWLPISAALVLFSAVARGQTAPAVPAPPTATPPSAVAPEATPAEQPPLAAPAPPTLTPVAPTPGAPAPTLIPEPAALPALTLDQRTPQTPAPGRPVPFYRKDWFWAAVGVVALSAAVILVASSASGSDAPATTLGNMRAF